MIHADWAENHAPDVIAYFSKPGGGLLNAGDRLVNKPYADFLRRLAAQGPAALYTGSTAAKIIARTHAEPLAGSMTMADLANYKPIKREPVCGPYRVYTALRAAAARQRRRADRADADPREHRHRQPRSERPAGLVPVRRGEPADVRRPRPLRRRSGLREGAGRRADRPRLCRASAPR